MAALSTAGGLLAGRYAYAASRVGGNQMRRQKTQRVAAVATYATNNTTPRGAAGGGSVSGKGGKLTRCCSGATAAAGARAGATPKATSEDCIYRVMSANQEISVVAVVGTELVADAAKRHQTAPTATAALGRSMLSALLLGTFKVGVGIRTRVALTPGGCQRYTGTYRLSYLLSTEPCFDAQQ
jgi:hypothetical protein